MELKRIIARDSRRATEKAIQQFGKDVLVISTQRVDDHVELIVAVDDRNTPVAEPQAFSPATFSTVFEGALRADSPADPSPASAEDNDADVQVTVELSGMSSPQPRRDAADTIAGGDEGYERHRSREIVSLLCKEVAALRHEFSLTRKYGVLPGQQALHPAVAPIASYLQDCGVPAGLHALLIDSLRTCESFETAMAALRKLLANALSAVPQTSPAQGVHALCGPSGAGKTTMVARLAASAAQRLGAESQAIVSFRDPRPGAWAQLQMLAAQAGVDCYRASSEESLDLLLDELSGRKNVWIDTSGIDFMAAPLILSKNDKRIDLHIVLPVDATLTNVRKVFEMPKLFWSSLMLSKLDESAHPWALMQALCDTPMPVSSLADTNRVAVQLAGFDADRVVDAALAPVHAAHSVRDGESMEGSEEAVSGFSTWAAVRASLSLERSAHA